MKIQPEDHCSQALVSWRFNHLTRKWL